MSETLPTADRWRVSEELNALKPERWGTVRLGDVAEILNGAPFPSAGFNERGLGVPVIRIRDVGQENTRTFFVGEFDPRYWVEPGDLLVGMDGDFRARVWTGPRALLNQRVCRVRFSSEPEFNRLWTVTLQPYLDAVERATSSLTVKHLSSGTVEDLRLLAPPRDECCTLVAKLDALRARSHRAKDALDAVPALLDRLRQSILAAAFRGDLTADWREQNPDEEPAAELLKRIRIERRKRWEESELAKLTAKGKRPKDDAWKAKYVEPEPVDESELPELPAGWCWSSVETVGDVLLGRRRAEREYVDGEEGRSLHPYVRVANVKSDRLDFSDVLSMPFSAREVETYRLRVGDVVLSEGQSLDRVGESAMYRGGVGDDLCIQATVHRFRAYSGVSPEFAQLLFMHHVRSQVFRRAAAITTNIAHLTSERLRPLPFPLAPAGEQEELVRRTRLVLGGSERLAMEVARATRTVATLDASVLAAAFRGELLLEPG